MEFSKVLLRRESMVPGAKAPLRSKENGEYA